MAELKDMPSFVLLISLMKSFEGDVLEELGLCKNTEELVRIGRFYPCLHAIRDFLETTPQAAASELERVKRAFFYENDLAVPRDVYRERFSQELESGVQ